MGSCLFHEFVMVPEVRHADLDGMVRTRPLAYWFCFGSCFAAAVGAFVQDSAGIMFQRLEFVPSSPLKGVICK